MRAMREIIKLQEYGEGHIAKQCTVRKRVKDSKWFKDKMLHAQAQEEGVVLNEEQQDFLANSLEEIDKYCDDEATANAIFLANLSPVGSLNDDTVEPRYDSDMLSESYDEPMSNSNVISYTDYILTIRNDEDNYVPPFVQKNDNMLSVIEQMKSQVEKCNMVNQESKRVNDSLTSELERYKDRVRVLEYAIKYGHSKQKAYLSHELYTTISNRDRKVSEYEKQYGECMCSALKAYRIQSITALPRAISEDLRLAREINALCAGLTIVIKERENFIGELDVLVDKFVPKKMVEFMEESQSKDTPNMMKL
ncbi:hypothetical protein Tco_1218479 [Tanacetum coccineum]